MQGVWGKKEGGKLVYIKRREYVMMLMEN